MRRIFVACLILPIALAKAQSEENTLKPKEPILLTAPNRAMWKVTTKHKKALFVDMASLGKQRETSYATIRKEGKIIQEFIAGDGLEYESYIVGPIRLSNLGKKGFITEIPSNDWNFSHYGGVDFDRCRWVAMSNFTGVGDYKGRKVFVFKISGDKKKLNSIQQSLLDAWRARPEGPKPPYASDSVAMLDVETQLPVYYSDDEVDETYEFLTPPPEPFAIPDHFKKELARKVAYLKAMKVPL